MKIEKNYLQIPISDAMPPELQDIAEFENVVKDQFQKHPEIAKFMRDLDAYSTQTYNHSVGVALLMYSELKKSAVYTDEEVSEWVGAALVHDAGKLTTPLSILHGGDLSDPEFAEMMRHSINGLQVAAQYGFSERCTSAIIGHHVDMNALIDPEHTGARDSKKTWDKSYKEGYIEGLLKEHFHLTGEKDIKAMSTLELCDQVEAMRSKERTYKDEIPWSTFEPGWKKSWKLSGIDFEAEGKPEPMEFCIGNDMFEKAKKFSLLPAQANRVFDKAFRDTTKFFQQSDEPTRFREMAREFTKGDDFVFSSDKIADVMKDPKVAIEFAQRATDRNTGQDMLVINLGQGQYAALPSEPFVPRMDADPKLVNINDVEIKPLGDDDLKFFYGNKMSKQINSMGSLTTEQIRNALHNAALAQKLSDDLQKFIANGGPNGPGDDGAAGAAVSSLAEHDEGDYNDF